MRISTESVDINRYSVLAAMLKIVRNFVMVCVVALPKAAEAQNALSAPLQPIDQTVEDRGPLSASFRSTQVDFRVPAGFQQLYRVPGRENMLMRINGGLVAVFPESVYAANRNGGVVPLIPAGTVFHIGLPPAQPGAAPSHSRTVTPHPSLPSHPPSQILTGITTGINPIVDTEVHRHTQWSVDDAGVWQSGPPAAALEDVAVERRNIGPSIVSDAKYRAQRIGGLLRRAAQAHADRASSGDDPHDDPQDDAGNQSAGESVNP